MIIHCTHRDQGALFYILMNDLRNLPLWINLVNSGWIVIKFQIAEIHIKIKRAHTYKEIIFDFNIIDRLQGASLQIPIYIICISSAICRIDVDIILWLSFLQGIIDFNLLFPTFWTQNRTFLSLGKIYCITISVIAVIDDDIIGKMINLSGICAERNPVVIGGAFLCHSPGIHRFRIIACLNRYIQHLLFCIFFHMCHIASRVIGGCKCIPNRIHAPYVFQCMYVPAWRIIVHDIKGVFQIPDSIWIANAFMFLSCHRA